MVNFTVGGDGTYFLRTIDLVASSDEGLTHESNWATLTFGVAHDESHHSSDHDHAHDGEADHEHVAGIPTWGYALGSLALIGVLFLVFRQRS